MIVFCLGMKGTMSEMELSTLRPAAHLKALKQRRARRGELFMTVAVGYVAGRQQPYREGSGFSA